ncbi:MAG: hypothetical protein JEY94_05445 [Melioribacteraceae bacterium]|nr:hypothetical protein [Melioribacteraceae bacterium]
MKKLTTINILLFIHIVFSLFLQTIPITNVLSYDFAAINGIWQAILASIITIELLKNAPEMGKSFRERSFMEKIFGMTKSECLSEPNQASVRNLKKIPHGKNVRDDRWFYLILIPLLPLIISVISTIFVQNCPICLGISFYFAVTIPAFIFGIFWGIISNYLSEKRRYILLLIIYLALVLSPILELYFNPQIYFYNPLIGFFLGTIYDEDISVSGMQILYTSMILIFSGSIFFHIKKVEKTAKNKVYLAGAILVVVGVFSFFKSDLGYSTDENRIENVLGSKVISEHFKIFYPESLSAKELKFIIAEHEYYYNLLEHELNISPKKITSFVFENREQKGELFGARNADVAKPWLNQIYIDVKDFRNSLKHELVHVFSAEFGVTPFKIAENFNPAMIEGIAMAVENDFQGMPVHQAAKLAEFSGYKIPLNQLFSGFNFFGNVSSLSYIYSGSFIKYLIDNYGIEKAKNLYGDIDFQKYYGKSIDSLQVEYSGFLEKYHCEVNKNKAQIYFGRKPITKKICARYAAERIKNAGKFYSEKKYKKSEEIYREIFQKTNTYSSFRGLVKSLENQNKVSECIDLLNQHFSDYDSTSYQYSCEILFADILIKNNEFEKADSLYSRLLREKPINYYKNFAYLRLAFLRNNRELLNKYLIGSLFDKYSLIKQLNKEGFVNESISIMLSLSEALNENLDEFVNYIDQRFLIEDVDDAGICFEIIDYLIKKGELEKALEFADKCKVFDDLSIKEQINNREKKINWMIEYIN